MSIRANRPAGGLRVWLCVVPALAVCLSAGPAAGRDFTWNALLPIGGFQNPPCWVPFDPFGVPPVVGPPGPDDTAVFDAAGTYQISFGDAASSLQLRIVRGDTTFLLYGYTYSLVSASGAYPYSINVGTASGQTCSLTVSGGTLAGVHSSLGVVSGATGTVTVDGTTSAWTNSGRLHVGDSGAGALHVSGGGQVSNTWGYVGHNPDSEGTVTVSGTSSAWTNAEHLFVGHDGSGSLSVTGGGLVSNNSGFVGLSSGAVGTVTVSGTGSRWTNSGSLDVGHGSLSISGGGLVSNTTGYVGSDSGATVTVSGTSSTWTNSRDLFVGHTADTGSLSVTGGGLVSNADGFVGYSSGAVGTATVDGTDSAWTSSGSLSVGVSARGSLSVTGGGQVSNTDGYVGRYAGAVGTATVEGRGSKWTSSGELTVGYASRGSLNVTGGGLVSNTSGFVGWSSGAVGTVTVSGTDSAWTNSGELYVGNYGAGSLSVTGGGQVSSTAGYVGRYAGSDGTVTVDGTGSKLTISGTLSVGDHGAGSLSVTGGGEVSNAYGFVGFSPGSNGTVTVSGTGSKWTNSEGLYVIRGSMNVSGGGKVSSAGGHVSAPAGSDSTVTVDGAGSAWTNSQHFYVGSNHCSGSLHITGGGRVSNSIGNIAFGVDASGTVTVDGPGSTWANSYSFWVGAGTRAVGSLSVTGGGRVTCPRGYIAYGDDSEGTVTVDGTGSEWTNSGNLCVAFDGVGSLSVTGGGQVSNTNGIVGRNAGSDGTVTVDGTGSRWTNTETLYVGGDDTGPGGTGAVTVRNGGLVSAAGLVLWHGGTTATVDGGKLEVESITGPADAALAVTDPTGGGEALTIGSADDSSFGGRIVDGAGGPGSVRKVGAGKVTLSALPAWSGATHVQEGILALPAGMFAPGLAVNVAEGAELQAVNMVNRQVTGDGRVTALGPLVIGDMTSTEGWSFAGTLDVGGSNVLLLDADVAELGAATTLAGGGKLNSFNGAQLGPADHADASFTLTATGSAVIDGDFRQNGLVTGPGGEDWLTFTDDVRGAGSFAGNIAFGGVYSPGNSIAAVALENAAFDATTVLRMELSADGGGTCDFLDISGALTAAGTLEVALLDGFAPRQGQAFDLLDWGALTGAFGWTDLPVLAGDLAWDTSSLYETGEISVVPEPATLAILSVAACLLQRRRKRR